MGAFSGQCGIVTGSAVGLGSQYARALAEEGANVVLCDIRPDVHATARALEALGIETLAFEADVANPADVRRVVAATLEKFGRIDMLINNAGVCIVTKADDDLDSSMDNYDKLMGTNCKGEYLFGRAVIPHMIAAGGGQIINIATDHVHTHPGRPTAGGPVMDLYDTSKWAVLGLTLCWARELAPHNIRVNSFSMGATDSNMLRGFMKLGGATDADCDRMAAEEWMSPRAVCDLAIQMLKEGPRGRTGENIGVWLGFEVELQPNPRVKPAATKQAA